MADEDVLNISDVEQEIDDSSAVDEPVDCSGFGNDVVSDSDIVEALLAAAAETARGQSGGQSGGQSSVPGLGRVAVSQVEDLFRTRKRMRCTTCKSLDHQSDNCTEPCLKCGQHGHGKRSRKCPKHRDNIESFATVVSKGMKSAPAAATVESGSEKGKEAPV